IIISLNGLFKPPQPVVHHPQVIPSSRTIRILVYKLLIEFQYLAERTLLLRDKSQLKKGIFMVNLQLYSLFIMCYCFFCIVFGTVEIAKGVVDLCLVFGQGHEILQYLYGALSIGCHQHRIGERQDNLLIVWGEIVDILQEIKSLFKLIVEDQ